jgi:rhamnogalacturonan endolyase
MRTLLLLAIIRVYHPMPAFQINFLSVRMALLCLAICFSANLRAADSVKVTDDAASNAFTLDNGIVRAEISKRSGNLISLRYKNLEMLDPNGRQPGYWEHDVARAPKLVTAITIDPKANGGERAGVSIKGISGGAPLGSGPGGSVVADVEIRYALGRGDSGVYTYSIFSHPTNYPATSVGESRFCAKLNDEIFDWMTVDRNRNMEMISTYDWNHGTPMNGKEMRRMNTGIYQGTVEHKYDYSANQFDVRAWGWSSTKKNVGIWFVNPSVEYLSGGPTKFELSAHRDATFNTNALNAPAPPTLLNYWRSSHYGGSICNLGTNDAWTKVIGPFLIYCNSGESGDATCIYDALWKNALAQADVEAAKWPFDWVNGVDYPHQAQRATVAGKIVLNDPQAPGLQISNLLVGLTAPDYAPAFVPRNPRPGNPIRRAGGGFGGFGLAGGGDDEAAMTNQNTFATATNSSVRSNANSRTRGGGFGLPRVVDWQIDARNYEFWVRADADGNFSIPNVRAGNYSLHAIADGVLGDLTVTNISVAAGKNLSLGKIDWQPVRYGKQLWDIGIPNRTAAEFFKGDDYFHWGWYLQYPKLFPLDVNYVVGQSDFHRDWFFEQVPYNTDTNNLTGNGRGDGTTWAVIFKLTNAPQGRATLRLAICGVNSRTLNVAMNSRSIGSVTNLVYNAAISRDAITGTWCERDLSFDAALMKTGTNTLELTVPPGPLTSGIMYDYLRLELDEKSPPSK